MAHPAILWESFGDGDQHLRCGLCRHLCVIAPGRTGICGVRENRGGALVSLVYGRTIARHVDPIEKKPLYHFLPGSHAYSVATPGCNFRCTFCQNWEISQVDPQAGPAHGQPGTPEQIAAAAEAAGCASVAYTYTEPTVFAEYALDIARAARERGLKNVFVSNGYMSADMIEMMSGLIDGINVDLKAGRGEFYQRVSGARLEPVLENLALLQQAGIWLEVTTLVIPGLNDGEEELRWVAEYLMAHLGPDVPWHVSRFYPSYRMLDVRPTPPGTLESAWEIGRAAGLHHVYVGNLPDQGRENTVCPHCGQTALRRRGYEVSVPGMRAGNCTNCGTTIAGVGMP
jgi:pyruvate formate lyase activating enzyme